MPHLSIVIPVFNAEACLNELYGRIREAVTPLDRDFELLLVDDASPDGSWPAVEKLAQADPRVKGLRFTRNFGQHYAISAGVEHAQGEWLVVMDCDLQDRPEDIPALYAKAREGYDVVLARHPRTRGLKRLVPRLFYGLMRSLSDVDFDETVGNFRILSKRVAKNFLRMREQLRFFGGMIGWLGFPTAEIRVTRDERAGGRSGYSLRKLFKLANDTIIAYSDRPLRMCVRFGFAIAAFSFLYGSVYLVRCLLYGSPVMGWTSLIVSLYFLSGIIIVTLGIIGLYLGKTFEESKKRPLYVVRQSTFALNE